MTLHPDYPTPEEREASDAAREDAADALRERLQEERDEMEREWIAEKIRVSAKMITYGDTFTRCLGFAVSCATPEKAKPLKAAFPEIWNEYLNR
jgi:hypothetical protein